MSQAMDKAEAKAAMFAEVDRVLRKHQFQKDQLIPILQEVQDTQKYLSREVMSYIASGVGVPPSHVFGVATFFAHFSLQPKGKYVIKLCDGTACHVKKSHSILDALYARLNLNSQKHTTDDLLFTIETVSCLGACGLAPAMVINGVVYGQQTPENALSIVDQLSAAEKHA